MLYAMPSVFGISAKNFRIDGENTHYTPQHHTNATKNSREEENRFTKNGRLCPLKIEIANYCSLFRFRQIISVVSVARQIGTGMEMGTQ